MRANDFGRCLAVAAALAAAWPVFALFVAPAAGARIALSVYLVAAVAGWAAASAPDRARGTGAALVAGGLAALAAVAARDLPELAVGAAIALGVARSGLLYRARPARALVVEAALLGGGLALAAWLRTPGPIGTVLALWGFFAVQAGFFAVGGVRPRPPETGGADRFERARRRALALLEE